MNRLYSERTGRGLLNAWGSEEALHQVNAVRFAADQFFNAVLAWKLGQEEGNGRVLAPRFVADPPMFFLSLVSP